MNISWCLFEIMINIYQGWLYCYFLNKRMTLKAGIGKNKHRIATIFAIAAVATFYSLYIWFDIPISDFWAWGITIIYSRVMFSDKWHVNIAWHICLAALMLGVINLCSMLLIQFTGATWELIMQPTALRLIYVLSSNLMGLLVIYVMAQIKPRQEAVSWGALLVFILMNVALVVGLEMQYQLSWENVVYRQQMLITMGCIIFVSLCTIILFELLSSKTERAVALEMQIENHRMMKVYNEELQAMYKEMMEHQHDMKHQFCILEELISSGELEESNQYLANLRNMVLPVRYKTGCIPVDAILTVKTMRMRNEGIEFVFGPYPLTELPVETQEFCALLGNVLDNAIEAVAAMKRGSKQRRIELKFSRIRDMLYVTCSNSAEISRIRRRGEEFLSTKHANRPGYGISSVKRIVDRVDGFFSFIIADDLVTVEIILPFREASIK